MKPIKIVSIIVVLTLTVFLGWKILGTKKQVVASGHEHGGHAHGDEHGAKGRVELTAEQLKNSGIVIEEAGSARLNVTLRLFGKIQPNEDHLAHVMPRYPGLVKDVRKKLGESVSKGEVLAVIESNESLRNYDVESALSGTIVEKHIVLGELASSEQRLFTIANLSTVWVDLNVYRQDFPKLAVGQKVLIRAPGVADRIEGKVTYISPFGSESTQTLLARAEIPNADGALRPGLFVTGDIVLEEKEVDVAVKDTAVQTMEDTEVIFVEEGDSFEARPVKFGQRDGEWLEVISGLLPGEKYAAANSFILKAEIGKSEAEHEH
jgi:cobalt-zinc-cadmium efflux system membrane fusion protein